MHFGRHWGHITHYKGIAKMKASRTSSLLFFILLFLTLQAWAAQTLVRSDVLAPTEPLVGSWTFSGMVTNENGERYGYFFQMQKQGSDFHAKTGLIDGQSNELILFYEERAPIKESTALNWQVGRAFIQYNPINDSWIFGVKTEKEKGFHFKVDMLQQGTQEKEIVTLSPGVQWQVLQTTRLNGHVHTGIGKKEQFVTGNNAWFGKLWFSKDQKVAHDVNTAFCQLNNENGFYSANLKEADAVSAAIAGWRDPYGKKIKMSQFITIKSLAPKWCLLSLEWPKLKLKVGNTLEPEKPSSLSVAGFFKENPQGFCFITEHKFNEYTQVALG